MDGLRNQSKTITSDQIELKCPLLLPTGGEARLVRKLCDSHGIPATDCATFDDLMSVIQSGSGPAVIADEAMTESNVSALLDWYGAQPDWSELPMILLGRPHRCASHIESLRGKRGITVLYRPLGETALIGLLQTGLESRIRQFQVRDLLEELRLANAELKMRANQLQRLALVLTQAEEAERRRIAHTLHDELQQLLAAARVSLSRMLKKEKEDSDREERCKSVEKIDSLLQKAIDSSRSLSHELSPPLLHHAGLGAALEQLAEDMQSRYGLHVDVHCESTAHVVDGAFRSFLFEAARELVFNAYKHSNSNSVQIHLAGVANHIQLTVADQGCGFDPDRLTAGADPRQIGAGLFGIREQAELLGGAFKLQTRAGQGTKVVIEMPSTIDEDGEASSRESTSQAGGVRAHDLPGLVPIRVLVVDDHRIMREGVVSMLDDIDDIDVVGEAGDGHGAVRDALKLKPDVVLMDVSLPGMNGVEATRLIRQQLPGTQVIGLSMFKEAKVADEMMDAGACAYLVKSGPTDSLISSILACR